LFDSVTVIVNTLFSFSEDFAAIIVFSCDILKPTSMKEQASSALCAMRATNMSLGKLLNRFFSVECISVCSPSSYDLETLQLRACQVCSGTALLPSSISKYESELRFSVDFQACRLISSSSVLSAYLKKLQKLGFVERNIDTRRYNLTEENGELALQLLEIIGMLDQLLESESAKPISKYKTAIKNISKEAKRTIAEILQ
jgi:DNA-binding HxlR family transcriptional regulator